MNCIIILQAPPHCNVLLDDFVPFIAPGHVIGEVGVVCNGYNIIEIIIIFLLFLALPIVC